MKRPSPTLIRGALALVAGAAAAIALAVPAGADPDFGGSEPPTTGPIERFSVDHESDACVRTAAEGEVQWEGFVGYADNGRVDVRGAMNSQDDCVYLPGDSTTPSVEFVAYGNDGGGQIVEVDREIIEDPEYTDPEFAFTLRNDKLDTITAPTIHRIEVRSCLELIPWAQDSERSATGAADEELKTCGEPQVLMPIACICPPGDSVAVRR